MAAIANVALTNTFDTWRTRTNTVSTRLNQFAINESSLYANTVTANVSLAASGTATVTGLFTASGRATVGTNLTVTGNTTFSTANTKLDMSGSRLTDYSEYAESITNSSTAKTIAATSNVVRYTLTDNLALTLPSGQPEAAPAVKTIVVYLKQDGVGTRTVTFAARAGESISYNNSATQPAAQTGASKVSIYSCMKFDADPVWYISLSYIDD